MNLSEVTRIEVRSLGPAEEPDRNRFGFRKEHRSPSPGIGGRVTRLRVVFTCPYSVRKVTGIGVFVSDLMRSLSHYGHEGWVVCPDGPGLTLCRQLQELFPRQPIVMYSTAALPAEQQAGLDAGARAYLAKTSDLLNIGSFLSSVMAS